MRGKKIRGISFAAALVVLMSIFQGTVSGCGGAVEETGLGRFAEREVEYTGKGYTGMYPQADGGYALYGEGKDLYLKDGEGNEKTISYSWRKTLSINAEMAGTVSWNGELFLSYLGMPDREKLEEDPNYPTPYSYLYADSHGTKQGLSLSGSGFSEEVSLDVCAFSPQGDLYASDLNGGVWLVDTEKQTVDFLFQANSEISEFGFMENTLIALDTKQAWLLDMETGELLENNALLDEFVTAHQTEKKSILLSSLEKDGNHILYLACRTGLYQYVWNGSVIEQIAGGELLTLGNTYYSLLSLQALDNGEFRVLFSNDRLVEMYYDETLPAKPEKELTIYGLEDDERIRYAAQLFQKQHPEVLVNFETGVSGDNSVTREDAVKNLNTKLLAGEGPDILLMDELDLEQYAGKGYLKSLDDSLETYLKDGLLFENIVNAMRNEDGNVYGIPMTVKLAVCLSDDKYLKDNEDLEDIVTGLQQARTDYPNGSLLGIGEEEDLLNVLLPVCLPAWTTESGELDTEKVKDFYESAAKIWELENAAEDPETLSVVKDEVLDYKTENKMNIWNGLYSYWKMDQVQAQMGYMDNPFFNMVAICALNSNIEQFGPEYMDVDVWYGALNGQAAHVFWGNTITAVCSQTKEPELAEEFLELLLSREMMDKWWLNRGYPVRTDSLAWVLDTDNTDYIDYCGMDKADWRIEDYWSVEDEAETITELMRSAAARFCPGTMLEKNADELGISVLKGEISPEEAAEELERKMSIEMEE